MRTLSVALIVIAVGCVSRETPKSETPADVAPAPADIAHGECEELARDALPIAAKQLQAGGEFRPFAMARNHQGASVGVSSAAAEATDSNERITALERALRNGGQRGDYVATALVTTMALANGGNALSFDLEHQSGYGKTLLIAFKRAADGQLTVDEQGTLAHKNVIFTQAAKP